MTTMSTGTSPSLIEIPAPEPGATSPSWLTELRSRARDRARELGLPTPRLESWRYTNLKPLAQIDFVPAASRPATLSDEQLAALALPGLEANRLVYVNGRLDAERSTLTALPDGVTVRPLAEAFEADDAMVREKLGSLATFEDNALIALNTASLDDGVLVNVPDGVRVEQPIHILHLMAGAAGAIAAHPRTLIVAGDKAAVIVVEDYAGLDDETYLTNAVTEIEVGAEAEVEHYWLQRESPASFSVSDLVVRQGDSSHFASHSVLLGGRIVRNNVTPILDGEHIMSILNGLYMAGEGQHMDNQMRVVHAKPNCQSRQFYKGILDGDAKGVFCGRILVKQIAQKTDAIQSNQSLLLSDTARTTSMPQLEIYADDVRCTHGATIGEMDDEAIFYLRSRGLSATAARGMMLYAFAGEGLSRMRSEPVRTAVRRMILDRIPDGGTLEAAVGDA